MIKKGTFFLSAYGLHQTFNDTGLPGEQFSAIDHQSSLFYSFIDFIWFMFACCCEHNILLPVVYQINLFHIKYRCCTMVFNISGQLDSIRIL